MKRMVTLVFLLFICGFVLGTFTQGYFWDSAKSRQVMLKSGLFDIEISQNETSPIDLGHIDPGQGKSIQLHLNNKSDKDARIYRIVLYPSETARLDVYNNVIMNIKTQNPDGSILTDVVSKRTSNFIEICGLKAGYLGDKSFVIPSNGQRTLNINFQSMEGTAKLGGSHNTSFKLKFYAEQVEKQPDKAPYSAQNDFLMTDKNWAAFIELEGWKNKIFVIKPDNYNIRNSYNVVSFKNLDTQESITLYFKVLADGGCIWDVSKPKAILDAVFSLYIEGSERIDRGFIVYPGAGAKYWGNILIQWNINGDTFSIPICTK